MGKTMIRTLMCSASIGLIAEAASGQTTVAASGQTTAAAPAGAAVDNDSGKLEEIVVSARKRSESLIDVPVAVTAISAATIQHQGITDLNRLAQLAPNIILARGDSGAGASFTIRGVGSPKGDAGIEQSVTLAIDGLPITRGNFVNQGLFDLAQVEVLKGPQALFFGKNSPAGVISLTTANPSQEFGGYIRAGFEWEAREKYVEGAITGALTDTLSARIAARVTSMRGWLEDVAQPIPAGQNPFLTKGSPGASHPYAPGAQEAMGRVSLKWDPTSNFNALAKVSVAHYHDNGTTTQGYCTSGTGPTDLGVPDPFADCKFDNKIANVGVVPGYVVNWPYAGKNGETYTKSLSELASLQMNLTLDKITLTSVTGYYNLDYSHAGGFSFTSFGNLYVPIAEKSHGFSQEFRAVSEFAGPLNFTIGAFYDSTVHKNVVSTMGFDVGPDPANGGSYYTFTNRPAGYGKTYSAFGQARYKLTSTLELAGGVRFTREQRRGYFDNTYVNPLLAAAFNLVPQGVVFDEKRSFSNWSPEATLTWKPVKDVMFYGAYKTGYKSGGFSAEDVFTLVNGQTPTKDQLSFSPEKVRGEEVGFKAMLADRTIRVEITAYNYKYSGLQVSIFDPATFSINIANAANARVKGVDISTDWRATHELTLNFAGNYNHARFLDFTLAPCYTGEPTGPVESFGVCSGGHQDLSGTPLVRAPNWTATGGATYEVPVNDGWSLGLSGDFNYSGSYYFQEDRAPGTRQDAFWRFNAGVRLFTSRYEIAFIGRNLTNKYYIESSQSKSFGSATDFQAATPRARELRLQVTYNF